MQTRYLYLLRFILAISDIVVVNSSFWITFFFIHKLYSDSFHHYFISCNITWLLAAAIIGIYTEENMQRTEYIYRATWKTVLLYDLLFVFYITFSSDIDLSKKFLIFYFTLLCVLFFISRFIGAGMEILLKKKIRLQKPVAVIGNNETGIRLAHFFETHGRFDFHGFIGEPHIDYIDQNGELTIGMIENLSKAAERGTEEIYVCIDPSDVLHAGSLIKEVENLHLRIKLVPDLGSSFPFNYTTSYINNFQIFTPRSLPLDEVNQMFKKRLFDILFSITIIIFILSWLFPIIILLQKLTSKGPIFFVQDRVGRKNKTFKCFKFRTMVAIANDNSNGYQPIGKGDKRITKFGTFLRKTSMDELPQFINVLIGDMSVVGPRPHAMAFNEVYSNIVDQIKVRHFVKPGITGWAQVHGLRGDVEDPEKNSIRTKNRINHDIWYIENWDFQLDVKIIFLTVWNIIKGQENAI